MALVMFDYDGVIVDSLEVFISCFSQACYENGFHGINVPKDVVSCFEGNVYETMTRRGISEAAGQGNPDYLVNTPEELADLLVNV